jgi:hypothetical protein
MMPDRLEFLWAARLSHLGSLKFQDCVGTGTEREVSVVCVFSSLDMGSAGLLKCDGRPPEDGDPFVMANVLFFPVSRRSFWFAGLATEVLIWPEQPDQRKGA